MAIRDRNTVLSVAPVTHYDFQGWDNLGFDSTSWKTRKWTNGWTWTIEQKDGIGNGRKRPSVKG